MSFMTALVWLSDTFHVSSDRVASLPGTRQGG